LALLLRVLLSRLLLVLLAGATLIAILIVSHLRFLQGMISRREFNPFRPQCVPEVS
jgi:hypothetical protein